MTDFFTTNLRGRVPETASRAKWVGEAGVDRFHIAHVLNHRSVTHSTVTAIYDEDAAGAEMGPPCEWRR
jgi:hypothetical protein